MYHGCETCRSCFPTMLGGLDKPKRNGMILLALPPVNPFLNRTWKVTIQPQYSLAISSSRCIGADRLVTAPSLITSEHCGKRRSVSLAPIVFLEQLLKQYLKNVTSFVEICWHQKRNTVMRISLRKSARRGFTGSAHFWAGHVSFVDSPVACAFERLEKNEFELLEPRRDTRTKCERQGWCVRYVKRCRDNIILEQDGKVEVRRKVCN